MNETWVTIVGNVAGDVTKRRTASGDVVNFRVMSSERRYDSATGEWQDGAQFAARVTCWRRLAENVHKCVVKGDPVVINGKLAVREYEVDGQRRSSTEIEARSVGLDLRKVAAGVVPDDRAADPAGEREAAAGRRSRHSAPTGGAPSGGDDGPGTSLPPVTRPTFDAFSTAPLYRPEPRRSGPRVRAIGARVPADRGPHAGAADTRAGHVGPDALGAPASAALPAEPWEPTGLDDRFTPAPDPRERDRSAAPRDDAEPVSSSAAVDAPVSPVGEPTSRPDDPRRSNEGTTRDGRRAVARGRSCGGAEGSPGGGPSASHPA